MRLSIAKQITLLLSLSVGGALMAFGVFYRFLSLTDTEAQFVEVASDQSLRADQLHDYADMVHSGQEEDRDNLQKIVDEYDQALRQLEGVDPLAEGEVLVCPQEVKDELAEVKQLWGEYKSSLLLIAARPAGDPRTDRAFAFIESTAPQLIKATDQLVDEYVIVNRRLEQRVFLVLGVAVGLDAILLLVGIRTIRNYTTERRQLENSIRVDLALQRVRNEVLSMQGTEDWDQLANCLGRELVELIAFDGCGVAVVDLERRQFYVYDVTPTASYKGEVCDFLPRSLEEAVETGKPVYRRNRAEMAQWGDNIGPERKSAIDVPFIGGTIGLNSAMEEAFSARDIATLQQFAQVVAEAHRRLQDLQTVERVFRREQAMGRVRSRIIAMRDLSELGGELEQAWVEELRGLGIPINIISLQLPAAEEGWFTIYYSAFLPNPRSRGARLADFPWVQEVWESGNPVVVDRERLDQVGFAPEVQHILEVPLATGGSLAVNTRVKGAFGPEAVHTVQLFAGLIAEGLQRLRDFEALRQAEQSLRVEVMMQRVRNEILLMKREEDWKKVALQFWRELRQMVDFTQCGINLVDLGKNSTRYYTVTEGEVYQETADDVDPVLRKVVEEGVYVYRSERSHPLFGGGMAPSINSVLDVPFSGGTVAINSTREEAFSPGDIQLLERFAQVLSEGYRRLEDLKVLVQQEEQLHQAQRLEAIGQLATGVAHEINNPLTSVLGYSELLLRRSLDPEVLEHLKTIHQEGQRAQEIAARLLQFVRRQKSNRQPLSLNLLVQEVLVLTRQQFELDHVRLVPVLAGDLPLILGQPGQLQQLLLALLQNGREAIQKTGKAGAIKVQTSQQGAWVRLTVEDDGPGIPAQFRERIFEPFFTTKEVGKGTGMGLSLCFAIAQEHGGRLWAEPRPTGACLVLELPVGSGAGESITEEGIRDAG